ncbi:beta-lactamase-like protein [Chytridium lagenaria]|nr:beta-lactamase-like protein [Chytridium lagenaria]
MDSARTAALIVAAPALLTALYAMSSQERMASVFMNVFNSPVGYYLYKMLAPQGPDGGHRKIVKEFNEFEAGPFRVIPVPYAEDNYGYICLDTEQNIAVVIDPADPIRVLSILLKNSTAIKASGGPSLTLKAILNTHHHWDHSAGNATLLAWARRNQKSKVDVYGSEPDFPKWSLTNILFRRVNKRVKDGDEFAVGRMVFRVISVPCHTRGSVVYAFDCPKSLMDISQEPKSIIPEPWSDPTSAAGSQTSLLEQPIQPFFIPPGLKSDRSVPVSLFTGDAVFVGGAGRFFEGTAESMSLVVKKMIATTAPNSLIWPGHEYAFTNLSFAMELEPSNIFLQVKLKSAEDNHFHGIAIIPSIWSSELETNPFFVLTLNSAPASSGQMLSNVLKRVKLPHALMFLLPPRLRDLRLCGIPRRRISRRRCLGSGRCRCWGR